MLIGGFSFYSFLRKYLLFLLYFDEYHICFIDAIIIINAIGKDIGNCDKKSIRWLIELDF